MSYVEIGAFDAKAKLSELLRAVKEGCSYTITLRSEPVADLIPSKYAMKQNAQSAVDAVRSIKKVHGISAKTLAQWVEEGRR